MLFVIFRIVSPPLAADKIGSSPKNDNSSASRYASPNVVGIAASSSVSAKPKSASKRLTNFGRKKTFTNNTTTTSSSSKSHSSGYVRQQAQSFQSRIESAAAADASASAEPPATAVSESKTESHDVTVNSSGVVSDDADSSSVSGTHRVAESTTKFPDLSALDTNVALSKTNALDSEIINGQIEDSGATSAAGGGGGGSGTRSSSRANRQSLLTSGSPLPAKPTLKEAMRFAKSIRPMHHHSSSKSSTSAASSSTTAKKRRNNLNMTQLSVDTDLPVPPSPKNVSSSDPVVPKLFLPGSGTNFSTKTDISGITLERTRDDDFLPTPTPSVVDQEQSFNTPTKSFRNPQGLKDEDTKDHARIGTELIKQKRLIAHLFSCSLLLVKSK